MKKTVISAILMSFALFTSAYAQAQAIEAVYGVKFDSTASVKATHTIVADYDNYAARDKMDKARRESHGWAKYMLATQDSKFVSGDLAVVVKDYGKARHEAGYLVVFTMQVKDPGKYGTELDKLNDAVSHPGVLRLVALRSGPANISHAVLVGAADFAAANKYLDTLFASDAYAAFAREVGDIRTLQNVAMYRRVGAWGY